MAMYLFNINDVDITRKKFISRIGPDDRMTIFYSKSYPDINIDFVKAFFDRIDFVSLTGGTPEEYIFQFSTYLGYLISLKKEINFIVLGNAPTYDVIINFWKQRSINICREQAIGSKLTTKTDTRLSENSENKEVVPQNLIHIEATAILANGVFSALKKHIGIVEFIVKYIDTRHGAVRLIDIVNTKEPGLSGERLESRRKFYYRLAKKMEQANLIQSKIVREGNSGYKYVELTPHGKELLSEFTNVWKSQPACETG